MAGPGGLTGYNASMKTFIALVLLGLLAACSNTPAPSMQSSAAAKAPDESAAIAAIAKINEAQSTYFKLNRRYALALDELVGARLLEAEPEASQNGYDFKLAPAADAQTYKLVISPATASPAVRYFYTDQSGVIHAESGKDATGTSPVIK
jgi:hypothetical protein